MDYQEYLKGAQSIDKILSRRCFAALIDYAIFFALYYAYLYLFGEFQLDGSLQVNGFWQLLIIGSISLFLFPLMESIFGYTMGKGLLDLKVVYHDKKGFRFFAQASRIRFYGFHFFWFGSNIACKIYQRA
ncbi:MAG: RDD family protein [Bacteroidota bacterium]|nr:RDD family protein [Bacteroidota bacterium]